MIKVGKVCTFIGEVVGLSTEVIVKGSGITINSISNNLSASKTCKIKKNKVEASAFKIGNKISNSIVQSVKKNEKEIDLKVDEIVEKIKTTKDSAYATKTTIIGDEEYLYGKGNILEEDYEILK